jgi:hypothetical protein
VVEKILRLLADTFENVTCAMEESKDLAELTINELVGSLLALEQRKNLKKKETLEETLQAKVILTVWLELVGHVLTASRSSRRCREYLYLKEHTLRKFFKSLG